jgi:hypothetical protein
MVRRMLNNELNSLTNSQKKGCRLKSPHENTVYLSRINTLS